MAIDKTEQCVIYMYVCGENAIICVFCVIYFHGGYCAFWCVSWGGVCGCVYGRVVCAVLCAICRLMGCKNPICIFYLIKDFFAFVYFVWMFFVILKSS